MQGSLSVAVLAALHLLLRHIPGKPMKRKQICALNWMPQGSSVRSKQECAECTDRLCTTSFRRCYPRLARISRAAVVVVVVIAYLPVLHCLWIRRWIL